MKTRRFVFDIHTRKTLSAVVDCERLEDAINLCRRGDYSVRITSDDEIIRISKRGKTYYEREEPTQLSEKELTELRDQFIPLIGVKHALYVFGTINTRLMDIHHSRSPFRWQPSLEPINENDQYALSSLNEI